MKSFPLIMAVVIISTVVFSAYALDPDTIVGIWLLDEDDGIVAGDSSGNGHDGEIKNAVTWDEGKFGSALNFAGGNVVIPHHEDLSLDTFTITAWVNLVNTGVYQALVEKSIPSGTRNYYLAVTPDGVLYGGFAGDNGWNSCIADLIADETWHHVAVTYDMKSILTYVDGESSSEISLGKEGGVDPIQNDSPATFGTTNMNGGEPAKGLIDEVGIFNVALTEKDIKNIMNSGLEQAALAVEPVGKLAATWGSVRGGENP